MSDELEDLERKGWDALSGPNGATFYEEVMHGDGVMVFPGLTMDKRASLEAIRHAGPWASFELRDVQIARVGDSGLVTYRAVARRTSGQAYEAVMSSVYVRVDGRWWLLLHQQSPDS